MIVGHELDDTLRLRCQVVFAVFGLQQLNKLRSKTKLDLHI